MRRLPNKPASEEYKHRQYVIQKIFQNRMVALIIVSYICLFGLLLIFFFSSSMWNDFKDRLNGIDCEVIAPNFTYGSTVIVECEGETAIIDSGIKGHDTELLNFLESREVEKIDFLIVSELSDEYLNVLSEISNSLEIGKIILPLTDDDVLYSRFDDMLFSNGVVYSSALNGMYLYFDDVSFTFYDPESVVVDVEFGNHSFLICNSDDENKELEIINLKPNLDTNVFISLNGNVPCDKFFETVKPEVFVLNNNNVDDIDLSSIERFSEKKYRTDLNGDIFIKSNEVDLKVECEKR